MGINASVTNIRGNEMTLGIYCHSDTEQSEKAAYSIIKATTD